MTLPEGWRMVTIGEVADTALGKMLDKGKSSGLPRVRYLRNVNVQWGRIDTHDLYEMELADVDRDRFGVELGDLLVCEGGEIGRSAIWRGDGEYIAFQKALHRIRPGAGLDPYYLRHALELAAQNGVLERHSTGSTIAHLPQQQLRQIPIALAPLDEQRRIVGILEEHLSHLDEASHLVDRANRRVGALRSAALDGLMRTFDLVPLRSLVHRIEAGRSFGGAAAPAGPDEWGVIKVSAMTWGRFQQHENKRVPDDGADPRYEIRPNDVLVSRANTTEYVGASVHVADVRPRLLLSDKSLRLVPQVGVGSRWLHLVLTLPQSRKQMSAAATGTKESMRNLSQENLLAVRVPNVQFADQAELLGRVDEIAVAVDVNRDALRRAQVRRAALRRALLQAAFSGQLTGRSSDLDRAEEIAS